jgi:integrase
LEEAMLKYLDSPEFTDLRSRRKLESHLRAVVPYVEGRPLNQAVEAADEMKRDMRHRGLQPATINRRLAIIRRVCNLAYKCWGWLDRPIGDCIELLSEHNERHIYLRQAEAEALIWAVEKPEARAAVIIAVYTGLRASEIFRLTKANIRGDAIEIGTYTKNNKPKLIPILPEVLEALAYVPLTITYRNMIKYFWKARQEIGRPDIRFHDLRHTLASWLVQLGRR